MAWSPGDIGDIITIPHQFEEMERHYEANQPRDQLLARYDEAIGLLGSGIDLAQMICEAKALMPALSVHAAGFYPPRTCLLDWLVKPENAETMRVAMIDAHIAARQAGLPTIVQWVAVPSDDPDVFSVSHIIHISACVITFVTARAST